LVYKEENRQQRWIQQARFPYKKTLSDFDFSFQPKLNQRLIYDLAACRFINKAQNIIFLGPPGVGKTHLMHAIANELYQKDPTKKIIYQTSEEFTNGDPDDARGH